MIIDETDTKTAVVAKKESQTFSNIQILIRIPAKTKKIK